MMSAEFEHRAQDGLLETLRFAGAFTREKCRNGSAKDFRRIAIEPRQSAFIASGDVALKIGMQDHDISGIIDASRERAGYCARGTSRAAGRACYWNLRIAIGCCHSARLELILTQRTSSAGNMQRRRITKVIASLPTGYRRRDNNARRVSILSITNSLKQHRRCYVSKLLKTL